MIICEELGIRSVVRFLIDSGASRTTILDGDAEKLAINHNLLERFTPGTTGIGGVVDTFILPNVRMIFRATDGFYEERLERLFVLRHGVQDPEAAERIKKVPSLLGRDILNKYRLILDRPRSLVAVTDERQ